MAFLLRNWSLSDLESLVKYADNEKIAANLMDRFPHPYTIENGKAFLDMVTSVMPPNVLAIEIDNEAVGGIGLHIQEDVYRKNAELGYWLAEPFWGKGIITAAVPQMVDYGFKNFDIVRIFARPFGRNVASQKVLEKAGFKLEAKFEKTMYKNGQFEDELVYAIRKSN
jgi:[ribosomal protein S5]-alanine N-acetyltransferase